MPLKLCNCCQPCEILLDNLDGTFEEMSDVWDFYGDSFDFQPVETTGESIAIAKVTAPVLMAARLTASGEQYPAAPPLLDWDYAMGLVLCWEDDENYLVAEIEVKRTAVGDSANFDTWLRLSQVTGGIETTLEEYRLQGSPWDFHTTLWAAYDPGSEEFHAVHALTGPPANNADSGAIKLSVGGVTVSGTRAGFRLRNIADARISAATFQLYRHNVNCVDSRCTPCGIGETPDYMDFEFTGSDPLLGGTCDKYDFQGIWNHHIFDRCTFGAVYTSINPASRQLPQNRGGGGNWVWAIWHDPGPGGTIMREIRQLSGSNVVASASVQIDSCMDDTEDIPLTLYDWGFDFPMCTWETISIYPGKS